jgi:hypothetical protein
MRKHPTRRFPPPWSVEYRQLVLFPAFDPLQAFTLGPPVSYSGSGVIFVGRLKSFGLALASFHGFNPLIAVIVAKLPELLGRHKTWGVR